MVGENAGDTSPAEESGAPWGHSVGGMPPRDNVDVNRGEETNLTYWDPFWKTPGVSGVTAYTVYDTTVPGQIIMSHYNAAGASMGEQECHYIVNSSEESGGIPSYLFLKNVAGGPTPYSYLAAHHVGATLNICAPHNSDGTLRAFASQSAAENDAEVDVNDETRLNTTGCNSATSFTATGINGEPWTRTVVLGSSPSCGNSVVEGGEECDDGDSDNTDGCTVNCRLPVVFSTGLYFACAMLETGDVKCWGEFDLGQTGYASVEADVLKPADVGAVLSSAIGVSAGQDHACAVLENGTVKCWGNGGDGALGQGADVGDHFTPVTVDLGAGVAISVTAGIDKTCAVLNDSTVTCWGLGIGGTPTAVNGISTALDVQVGAVHDCALLNDGTLRCWGSNEFGGLGTGGGDQAAPGNHLIFEDHVVGLSVNDTLNCAVLANGAVKCWGGNNSGELGQNNTSSYTSPVTVNLGAGLAGTSVSTLIGGVCAVLTDGNFKCWGYSDSYLFSSDNSTIGDGIGPSVAAASEISMDLPVISIEMHQAAACAILNNGDIQCWGYNDHGGLGIGSVSGTPITVDAASNVVF